jgi:hypothetical protein
VAASNGSWVCRSNRQLAAPAGAVPAVATSGLAPHPQVARLAAATMEDARATRLACPMRPGRGAAV